MPLDEAPGRDPRPLYSAEAEQAVLGAILLSSAAFDAIAGMISVEHFAVDRHRLIFRALRELIEARRGADVLTVCEPLRSAGDLENAGGMVYLHECATSTASVANVRRYAEIVVDRALVRRVLIASNEVGALAREANGLTGSQLLDQAQRAFQEIPTQGLRARGELRAIADYVLPALNQLDEATRAYHKHGISGISTGFEDLDGKIGGMLPGQLIVIAGRPGMGKTAIALNIGRHVALVQRRAVGVFSMEMEAIELAIRLLADLGNVHGLRLAHGRVTDEAWESIGKVAPTLESSPIFVCEDGALSVAEISAGARRMAREAKGELGLLVIDYLGLMRTERITTNRAQDLAEISRGFKSLAKELKVPIILLAQLNRECEKRADKRPILSDLRDSGEIEADADKVLMLYRDAVYHELDDHDELLHKAEVLIRKQRSGPVGKVYLHYDGARTRFSDWRPLA